MSDCAQPAAAANRGARSAQEVASSLRELRALLTQWRRTASLAALADDAGLGVDFVESLETAVQARARGVAGGRRGHLGAR